MDQRAVEQILEMIPNVLRILVDRECLHSPQSTLRLIKATSREGQREEASL